MDTSSSDEYIMNQVKSGKHNQFSILFERHSNGVFNYFMQWTRDVAKAEDLTQDVFIKIFKNRNKFKGTNFKIWMYTISRNLRTDFYRNKVKMRIEEKPVEEILNYELVGQNFEADESKSFDHTKLKKALEVLPDDKKEVLFMQFFQGLKSKEIAEIIGISPENARARSHRAIKELRNHFSASNT